MYRLVDCGTWDDPWFAGLSPNAKLFFLYLVTNRRSTSCGAFEITVRQMAFETGIAAEEIEGFLREFAPRVMWWPTHNVIWLRNFYKRQGNQNEKTRTNAMRLVAELPLDVQREIAMAYPELGPSIDTRPIPDAWGMHQKRKRKNNEQENENENENERESEGDAPAAPVRVEYPSDFEEFWRRYPSGHGNKKQAYLRWRALKPPERERAVAGLDRWLVCDRWQRGMVKAAETWLKDRWFDDTPPVAPARASPPARPNGQTGSAFTGAAARLARMEAERDQGRNGARPEPDRSALLAAGEERPGAGGDDGWDVGFRVR